MLVSVARKALDADAMHREEIAAYGRRLLAADKTHEALLGAVAGLKKTCGEVGWTPQPQPPHAGVGSEPMASQRPPSAMRPSPRPSTEATLCAASAAPCAIR